MSWDVHLDLGFNKKLEALFEVFHHLRSHFFPIPALYEVGYWGGCLAYYKIKKVYSVCAL